MSPPRVRWIVSIEDTPYHTWQALLFAHSAWTRCGVRPSVVIHDQVNASFGGAADILNDVVDILRVQSYRGKVCGLDYPPRNFPGTLLEAAHRWALEDDWFVLFDPDMLFVQKVEFVPRWSADRVGYGPAGARVGVPYVIQASRAEELAWEWLRVLDSAKTWTWEMVMWAYVVAMRRLGIGYAETQWADSNFKPLAVSTAPMIHYCYGDEKRWTKRAFQYDVYSVFERIPIGIGVSIEGKIYEQLDEVRRRLGIALRR